VTSKAASLFADLNQLGTEIEIVAGLQTWHLWRGTDQIRKLHM
jgi:hypothetical protein